MRISIFLFLFSAVCFSLIGCDDLGLNRYEIIESKKGEIVRLDKKTGTVEVMKDGRFFRVQDSSKKEDVTQESQLDTSWRWSYSEISAKEKNYPIKVLRAGFKVIKRVGSQVLVGWKYTLLNTSPEDWYKVEINYDFMDKDSFEIASDTSSELVRAKEIGTVKHTLFIEIEDSNQSLQQIGE